MSKGAKHILFVDDEGEVRFTASRYFKKHDYQVSTAESAEEALRMADGATFDAIVLDLNLAGEDGLKLMSFLKRNHPGVPIILFTGMVHDEETVKKFLSQGAARYLNKGAKFEELHKAVEEVLKDKAS